MILTFRKSPVTILKMKKLNKTILENIGFSSNGEGENKILDPEAEVLLVGF